MMVLATANAAVLACAKSDDATEELGSGRGQCANRAGITYLVHYEQRPNGTCGAGTDRIINASSADALYDGGTDAGSPCTGFTTLSADNCEANYDNTCSDDGVVQGGKSRIAGHSEWSVDGSHAKAVEQWSAMGAGGQVLCNSTYDVTFTRQ